MNYVKTMIAAIALMSCVFQTGCIEEELIRPIAEDTGDEGNGAGRGPQPEHDLPEVEDPRNRPDDGEQDGASPEGFGEGEGDEDDDAPGSPVCLGFDGEVAHECEDGFRCVEVCESNCEGEECPAICHMAYRCEADDQPAPGGPGDVENPIGRPDQPNEDEEDGIIVSPIGGGDDEEGGVMVPMVPGGDHDGGDEDDGPGESPVCRAPDGNIALECEDGFQCVERCVSPCEDGEEVCAPICRIEYACQAL